VPVNEMFDIGETSKNGTALLTLRGEFDATAVPALRESIQRQIDAGCSSMVVNLLDARFIDSTTLGVLAGAQKRLAEHGADPLLVVAAGQIARVFRITGLDRVLAVSEELPDTLTA